MRFGKKSTTTPAPKLNGAERQQRIAEKAHGLYLERGQHDGHDVDDWLEAERLILAEIGE